MRFRLEIEKPDKSCIGCEFFDPPTERSGWCKCYFGRYETTMEKVNKQCDLVEVQDE